MSLDPLFKRAFGDEQSAAIGSGWISGVLAVFAGALALGGVLCVQFPEWLTTPAFRSHYSIPLLRRAVQLLLAVSLAAAWVMYRSIERPSQRLASRIRYQRGDRVRRDAA